MYILNNLRYFHLSPFGMNKELNIRIFRQRWPATSNIFWFFFYVWKMFCVTMLQRRVALDFFFYAMAKMVELDFGGFFFSTLIYLNHYSKMDLCCSCLIAFMFEFLPPSVFNSLSWLNSFTQILCLFWQQFNLKKKKTVLDVTDSDVGEFFLFWAEKWERNTTYVI